MEDAESEVIREKVWKWYCGTIYNRLQPGVAIVLIGHRLHQDDLHGCLIEQMKAGGDYTDRWGIVLLPAIAEAPSELNEWAEDPLGRAAGAPLWQRAYPWRRVRVHGQARPSPGFEESVSFKAPFDRDLRLDDRNFGRIVESLLLVLPRDLTFLKTCRRPAAGHTIPQRKHPVLWPLQ